MSDAPATAMTRRAQGRQVPVPGTWTIDPTHTNAEFVARHLMMTKVRGGFTDLAGTIVVAEDPTESRVAVTIQAASIYSGTEDRDNHLRSPDFLDVETFPVLEFQSTKVEPTDEGWTVAGDLTIRGTTKPVVLDMQFLGVVEDPWGNGKAAFEARTEINREDWDLTWNVPLETGGVLVSKKVTIEVEAQAVLQS